MNDRSWGIISEELQTTAIESVSVSNTNKMSIFATQPISAPPPSYSCTRHQPPSYFPSYRSPPPATPRTTVPDVSKSTSKNITSWLTSVFSSNSSPRSQNPEVGSEEPPIYRSPTSTTTTTPTSPSHPPPKYSPTLPSPSTVTPSSTPRSPSTPKPTRQHPFTETDLTDAEYELQVLNEERQRKEEEETEEEGEHWCCNWFWVAPPTATTLPWEGWYVF